MNCPNCGSPHMEWIEITDIPGPDVVYWLCQDCACEVADDGEILGWDDVYLEDDDE